jgi:glycosyltransferase involved in cell wall biosynthesis
MTREARERLVAVVPAYNESGSIAGVVRDLASLSPPVPAIVVDDASTDDTAEQAKRAGAEVLRLAANLGIGGAVQTGFRRALERGADVAVQVDGDGQHPASEVPRLAEPVLAGEADVVIGSRFLEGEGFQSSLPRRAGIRVLSHALRMLTGERFLDPTSGFRAYSRRVLEAFAEEYPEDYPEPESLLTLVRDLSARVVEVPVVMRPREAGRSSIRGPASLYYMAKVLTAVIVGRFR